MGGFEARNIFAEKLQGNALSSTSGRDAHRVDADRGRARYVCFHGFVRQRGIRRECRADVTDELILASAGILVRSQEEIFCLLLA